MAGGVYLIDNCIAMGEVVFFDIAPNTVVPQPWSFRVNDEPEVQTPHDANDGNPEVIAPERVARGYDGRLYDVNRGGKWMADCHTFRGVLDSQVDDLPLPGRRFIPGITMGLTATLTLEKYKVDDDLLTRFLAGVPQGTIETVFAFLCRMHTR